MADAVPLISVVVPVYKEERNIRPFLERTVPVLEKLGPYEILFCLDPSPDRTEEVILAEAASNRCIGLLVFSRRFGQPAATMAGILNCRGAWCVVIDVDLQDPPEVIPQLFEKAKQGFEVVTAKRSSREGETLVKRVVSAIGYKVINSIAEVRIPRDTGDFRLMSRRVIEELRGLSESHGFLRGLVAFVGFRQGEVVYERHSRHSGTGNYNRLIGSLKIGFNGIFGFSTVPLQLMMWVGFTVAALSAVAIVVVIILKLILGDAYPLGIPTITILILFIGGVQLTAVGVLGEYIGRIYEEVRDRPLYIVDRAENVTLREARGPRGGRRRGDNPVRTGP
ncbi:MAG TPA: glycosyltransferase family 2 protein [Bauldia sp.]|nr:glycosyltransferase family 2 protein [Bauldia sp.]